MAAATAMIHLTLCFFLLVKVSCSILPQSVTNNRDQTQPPPPPIYINRDLIQKLVKGYFSSSGHTFENVDENQPNSKNADLEEEEEQDQETPSSQVAERGIPPNVPAVITDVHQRRALEHQVYQPSGQERLHDMQNIHPKLQHLPPNPKMFVSHVPQQQHLQRVPTNVQTDVSDIYRRPVQHASPTQQVVPSYVSSTQTVNEVRPVQHLPSDQQVDSLYGQQHVKETSSLQSDVHNVLQRHVHQVPPSANVVSQNINQKAAKETVPNSQSLPHYTPLKYVQKLLPSVQRNIPYVHQSPVQEIPQKSQPAHENVYQRPVQQMPQTVQAALQHGHQRQGQDRPPNIENVHQRLIQQVPGNTQVVSQSRQQKYENNISPNTETGSENIQQSTEQDVIPPNGSAVLQNAYRKPSQEITANVAPTVYQTPLQQLPQILPKNSPNLPQRSLQYINPNVPSTNPSVHQSAVQQLPPNVAYILPNVHQSAIRHLPPNVPSILPNVQQSAARHLPPNVSPVLPNVHQSAVGQLLPNLPPIPPNVHQSAIRNLPPNVPSILPKVQQSDVGQLPPNFPSIPPNVHHSAIRNLPPNVPSVLPNQVPPYLQPVYANLYGDSVQKEPEQEVPSELPKAVSIPPQNTSLQSAGNNPNILQSSAQDNRTTPGRPHTYYSIPHHYLPHTHETPDSEDDAGNPEEQQVPQQRTRRIQAGAVTVIRAPSASPSEGSQLQT